MPGLKLRTGLRVGWSGLQQAVLPSPRFGLSLPLRTGTIPKISGGLYRRTIRDPFVLAADFGNPTLQAEQARHSVLGVDQGLPLPQAGHVLLRVEAYNIQLRQLIVNPDREQAVQDGLSYTNDGSGWSRGIDVMAAVRAARFNLDLTYALLYTQRHNPLNRRYAQTIAPPQDQRHSVGIGGIGGDVTPFPHWRFTGRYSFHTGRPVSTVSLLSAQWQSVQIECLNCDRIGPTHSIDLRAEWRRSFRTHKLSVYAEVLNVGNIRSPYLPTFTVVDGQVEQSWFRHLPMRPFAGVRSSF